MQWGTSSLLILTSLHVNNFTAPARHSFTWILPQNLTAALAPRHSIASFKSHHGITTRPCAQVHAISTLHCMMVVTHHKVLMQHQIANTATCATANADCVACTANKEQRCSLASTVFPNVALHLTASRQQCSSARVVSADTAAQSSNSWQHRSVANTNSTNAAAHSANSQQQCSAANASCWCRLSALLTKAFARAAAACWRCSYTSAAREQQSCLYCKHARVALSCCCHKVWRASQMWRWRRRCHRMMVWAAAIHRARAVLLHIALHDIDDNNASCARAQHFNVASHIGNNNKASCTSARHLYVALHNGNDDKALCASAHHFQRHIARQQQQQGLVRKHTTFIRHAIQRQQQQGLVRKRTSFICCIAKRQQQQGLVRKHTPFSTSRCMMATKTTRKWLQQPHMLTTSPIAHELFHILHCAMATTTTRLATTPLFSTSHCTMATTIASWQGLPSAQVHKLWHQA